MFSHEVVEQIMLYIVYARKKLVLYQHWYTIMNILLKF
ncbi:hypothetical protein APHWI1_0424 [Anaplasma phagocytophilum str. ApWI1]|uniref:Uncharacterized protein n=1 Tax=Anaplasma phagocytophilum str. ApWI1 TaxID=1359155 RepID=A0A0F3PVK8_ANAPH|nr:hypothetical protein APHWEB_1091 [Anaplasma phagocytophilum str. Webster]KJV82868.1 hypothetical protein APHHGE2_1220 [Anaplasma phagocytophilum str. HGE2]KJV84303.1 hypothetical protein APHWI1_0424 [Anaplasma phagocytophilum str. ApWI1]KJV86823.1 hypothetical protein APHNYW_0934 [Anaplasma phagocytophilum str. ApNYW]KJV98408.1 hypothetical protein OTSANNIE_1194 [Anaplasma phagocytophilum str. Annie]KJZ98828.1 hypothetical protein APHCR_0410 [Anaplasma phagocytophilum str. CR1007]KKA00194.